MQPESDLVVVHAPTKNDAAVAVDVLRSSGLQADSFQSVDHLCEGIAGGCAVIIVAQEALIGDEIWQLQKCLSLQPPWSDVPIVLLAGSGASDKWKSIITSGNISVLERPFSRQNLINTVEVALRARKKQYQARQLIEDQRLAAVKRDEFFATLSHELRTPLNVMLGWIEILIKGDLPREAQLEALKILDRNAHSQKSLIDDLLDTSRIITGKLYFEFKQISLNQMLQSLFLDFQHRADDKGIEFRIKIPDVECAVLADESRLFQVFTNLLTNAIKFTPSGGAIVISLVTDGTTHTLVVKDTGQGMDPEFLPFVFDRLKQEDMSTTRSHGGLGLGLAIATHIIEEHSGKLTAASAGRGKGSEFSFTLPALTGMQANASLPDTVATALSLNDLKILVVDDSPDIRQLIKIWLSKAQATVRLVASGAEALAILDKFRPDILISDIGMPDMDGYQLIQKIRALDDQQLSRVPAAALTAYAKDEERARALAAGFQLHISKPITKDELVRSVATLRPRSF